MDLLPYAMAVLRVRLGPAVPDGKDPKEPSEEVRAKLHAVLVSLLTKGEDECVSCAPEAVDILEFAVEDSHADVALLACESLETLVHNLGRKLAPVSKNLAWMFFPNLTHRRAKVKIRDALRREGVDALRRTRPSSIWWRFSTRTWCPSRRSTGKIRR